MVRTICKYPDPVLREETQPVINIDKELKVLIRDMFDTMHDSDGIGLAAPQIGVSLKLVVIHYKDEKFTLINPEILSREGEVVREEGCLSFPGLYEKVTSPDKISVRYLDENGEEHTETIEGFKAAIFCHEIDHLNGRLLIDRVSPIKRQFMKRKLAKGRES